MEPVMIAVLVGIVAYVGIVALIPKRILTENTEYKRRMLKRLESDAAVSAPQKETGDVITEQMAGANRITQIFLTFPGAKSIYPKLLKAGMAESADKFFVSMLFIGFLLMWFLKGMGIKGILLALALTYLLAWFYINRRVKKRNNVFLNDFPDALDMIVRSVRSGYPLAGAVRMVADNMQAPISTEFKQVADETAYGSSLVDALQRLCQRIDEPDIRFFVVVLSVQQEVGGNLAEVLSNLSGIIRKRKHLRLKVKAITSEGRATAWVLGSLPVFVFFVIRYIAPDHLNPLFDTRLGNMMLAFSIGIVILGVSIVRKMSNLEI